MGLDNHIESTTKRLLKNPILSVLKVHVDANDYSKIFIINRKI